MNVSQTIINWYSTHKRDLPWRNTLDPYRIWLSEVILQQTRVAQGLAYYEAFVERFPTVEHLAQADQDQVLRLWQGLGYYSRARNLHVAAQQVVQRHGGKFPADYQALGRLQGIGDYTAAAIASFAFGLPHAVVDGNVYRVLSRVFGIELPIDSGAGRKLFAQIAQQQLPHQAPGLHNQALMEFGALHCTPHKPLCPTCPLQGHCVAWHTNRVAHLPIKQAKATKRERFFVYWVLATPKGLWLQQRNNPKDIWYRLFEFPHSENQSDFEHPSLPDWLPANSSDYVIQHISKAYKHVLSHQLIWAKFVLIATNTQSISTLHEAQFLTNDQVAQRSLPRLLDRYFREEFLARQSDLRF